MKVLVTGANGFLANNVIRELNRRNIDVRALVRSSANLHSLSGLKYEIFRGDFTLKESAMQAVKGCNVIMHIAADTSQHYSNTVYNSDCNINGTENLLNAAVNNQSDRFIYVSTANAFAHGTKEVPGDETSPARFPFTLSGYAVSKSKAQDLVIRYSLKYGLSSIIVNPAFMIGPFDFKPSSGKMVTMMYHRKVIPVPPGGKNFIHVCDVAYAICNSIDQGRPGECYLLANENLSYSEFYRKMEHVSGKKYYQVILNNGLMATAGIFGKIVSYTGYKTDLNPFNARILCEGNYYTSAKAVRELGLPQTPVDTAINDALEWFGRNGYL
ncbi:MAG TPA: NAD-dependent epimerase/dehydratase family protein [Bacteroidales bacterium]|jgi:dihydroflavonol-4-reductase|nr:NAD-dependent epimerase/dehydratase family protein [Bacteroidales bacterium]